ncbi:MAG TPA: 1,4-dihydroxy-2-naphthoate octaprenyltransferase, partial [Anaerolineae bacterium]|nr:1,4-dihydroxy-2-naphthoate octaprenyltransferase [Anaerolineae bacterium]
MAIRPKTLPAAVSPVLVGIALAIADEAFDPLIALAAMLCALLIQIGTNLANDYFDYVKGVDVDGRIGPTRVAQSGLISLAHLRFGIVVTFALAVLLGLYLVAVGGWPVLLIGLASLVSALAYTGGPFPIGYHGLGDLFVFLFFG